MGKTESLFVTDTYQFDDYSKYVSTAYNVSEKLKCRKEIFPEDCKKAFELGKRLVQIGWVLFLTNKLLQTFIRGEY